MSGTTTSLNISAINLWFLWKRIAATCFIVMYSSGKKENEQSLSSSPFSPNLHFLLLHSNSSIFSFLLPLTLLSSSPSTLLSIHSHSPSHLPTLTLPPTHPHPPTYPPSPSHLFTHPPTYPPSPSSSSCCIICILASAGVWRGGAITDGGGGPYSLC